MRYADVPEEIRRLPQWVCAWNNSKIPMRAYEKRAASSVDPESWSSFTKATQAVNAGLYDHIGFVFADNGIVGIDIDVGFEDGLLTPIGADTIGACHSYTEKSKSGRGVHILVKGDLPFPGKNNRAGVEIYKSRRFFITTGNVMLYHKIIENQQAIDYVVQKYFPEAHRSVTEGLKNPRIYSPEYLPPEGNNWILRPYYPPIGEGGRNISLTSLAGQMHTQGYPAKSIYKELLLVNKEACKPPLPVSEIQTIVNSITKYRRD